MNTEIIDRNYDGIIVQLDSCVVVFEVLHRIEDDRKLALVVREVVSGDCQQNYADTHENCQAKFDQLWGRGESGIHYYNEYLRGFFKAVGRIGVKEWRIKKNAIKQA